MNAVRLWRRHCRSNLRRKRRKNTTSGHTDVGVTHPSRGGTPRWRCAAGHPEVFGSGYPEYIKRLQKDMWFGHKHIQDRVKQKQDEREQQNSQLKSILKFRTGDKVMI